MSWANAQMGTLRLQGSGFLGTKPCCIPSQPVFGVFSNLRSAGRIAGSGVCAPPLRGRIVLSSAEACARPTTDSVLEKELTFSPAFGDYVKVLESVQIDRRTHPGSDSESSNARSRSRGNDGPGRATNKEKNRMVEPRVAANSTGDHADRRLETYSSREQFPYRRGKGKYSRDDHNRKPMSKETERDRWYPAKDAPKKARAKMRNVNSGDTGKLSGGTSLLGSQYQDKVNDLNKVLPEFGLGKRGNGLGYYESQLQRNSSPSRIDKVQNRSNMRGSQCSTLDVSSTATQRNTELDTTETDPTGHYDRSRRRTALDNSTETRKQQGSRSRGDFLTKRTGAKVSKIDRTIGMNDVKSGKVARERVDNIELNDRAAFKTFEVFTDINNRPRVLRMELEERIQNLAKRLHATDVNMPMWKFSKLIHDGKIKFTDHSILRIVQILGAFGNWRRVLQVVDWLQSQEHFKSYKMRYIYTTVLSVLGKAKRPVEALNVFNMMRQELSSYPDLAAYHCIAVILGQAGLMKELFDVIDCMRAIPEKKFKLGVLQKWDPRLEPDLVVYNSVLNACVQQKQWEGAFWVLQELKKKGIRPSNTTYGLVMEVMLVCGKYNLVHEFFRKLEKSSIPGALNYKVLVNAYWREGKIDDAVSAVDDMERRGIVGSASLYYDLARCLCSGGRCQEALLQINKLCKVAQKPLVVTYTGLIQTCLDSGSIENASYIFKQMCKFCSPNVVTCNIMLKAYVKHGMFQDAACLFEDVLEGNKCLNQQADLNGKVLPDKFTFNTMMEACVVMNRWDDFVYAYEQMLHHGYHFDARRHLHMVMEASRAGKVQVLETTFEHLVSYGRTPPPSLVKEMFFLRLQNDDCVAALSCLDISEPAKLQFYSEEAWMHSLNSNINRYGKPVLGRLASEIENLPSQVYEQSPVLQNLLKACKRIINSSATSIAAVNG